MSNLELPNQKDAGKILFLMDTAPDVTLITETYKFRVFESYGIYISIPFSRNLNREPAWCFIIENIEDELYKSRRYASYDECEKDALKKAVEYI